ncbi:glycosyltransferase family 4 protein [Gryllotalpicola reticulitermitis]|uniref:Glycosyltransferase family 4 protein n=1 Tax=Gryllotalpicola reticulitermitis TaxID=1184153 RepID=A0ABV8Q5M3_9MICO
MKIAMISYYLPSGSKIGVGYQAHEIASALAARGHDVHMFSACPPVDGAVYEHHLVDPGPRLRTFAFAFRLRALDFSGYDVVHAHGDDYLLWGRRMPRHVRTIHGSCFEEALRIRGGYERLRMLLLGFSEVLASLVADASVAVSPQTRRWTPWVRRVIPNGVDAGRFRPEPGERAQRPTILFVGTWGNRKRGGELAAAFQRSVLPVIPDAELEMVCRDAPDEPGLGIRILGRLDDQQLAAAYRRAWVFCLPSAYEGFGIPYAEALSSGTPVIATPNVGARYVTDDGRAGVLAPLDDLGAELVELLRDADRRDDLTGVGLERARSFDLDTVVEQYERLYSAGPDRAFAATR